MPDDWIIIISYDVVIVPVSWILYRYFISNPLYVHSLYYCIINLVLFYNVVIIITQPMNVTVCLPQNATANFTCEVDAGSTSITTVGWQILDGTIYIPVVGRDRHMLDRRTSTTNGGTVITETLTVTDVSLSDNGAKYRCRPVDDVISDVVTLTVIGINFLITCTLTFMCTYYIVHTRHMIQFYFHVYVCIVHSYTYLAV